MCVIVKFRLIYLSNYYCTLGYELIDMFMLITYGYLEGKGKDSYLLCLEGKGILEIGRYANGRVNTLPLP
jgi:hypothetical protein